MQNSISKSTKLAFKANFPGRHPRSWVSFIVYGCHYDHIIGQVMRCPVINGIALVHLARVHKIIAG